MDARLFVSLSSEIHEPWLAYTLKMQRNPFQGPDIIDDKKVVELKSRLLNTRGYYNKRWTPQDFQMGYETDKPAFWALQFYRLERDISRIKTTDPKEISKMITSRNTYIVSWEWMNKYPPRNSIGRTKKSKWNNIFRYPKGKDLPAVIESYECEGGIIHLTRDIDLSLFDIRGTKIRIIPS